MVVETAVLQPAVLQLAVLQPVVPRRIAGLIVGLQLFVVALFTLTPTPASDFENIFHAHQ
jgi:hypothetical protein